MDAPRAVLALAVLVVTVASTGCGSTSTTFGVRDVERAFFRAGVPFQSETGPAVANPYLRSSTQKLELPGQGRPATHVEALLAAIDSRTFTAQLAYVFDSVRAAKDAVAAYPLSKWLRSSGPVIDERVANVVVLAAPRDATTARRIRAAIGTLEKGR